MNEYYTYILTNRKNSTLYIGVTNNLLKRVYEHKLHLVEGFTDKYHTTKLVHYEIFGSIITAITREKRLKKWNRSWKIELIEKYNPKWKDLYFTL